MNASARVMDPSAVERQTSKGDKLEELAQLARNGDREALSELIERTHLRLFRFCLYLTRNKPAAQDLCQETYLRVIKNIDGLKDAGRFYQWLLRVARNLHLDERKSPRSWIHVSLGEKADAIACERAQKTHESYMQVTDLIKTLEAQDQLIFRLLNIEQYTYGETAVVVGLTSEAVRYRASKIRKFLAVQIQR